MMNLLLLLTISEKKYPFRHKITALGIDGKDIFEKMYPDIDAILYDGIRISF